MEAKKILPTNILWELNKFWDPVKTFFNAKYIFQKRTNFWAANEFFTGADKFL